MRESWSDERLNAVIDQLRGELRDVQRLMLRGAIVMCVFIQVIGFFVLAAITVAR